MCKWSLCYLFLDVLVERSLLKPFTAQRCRSATEKFILEDLFSSVLSQYKKYHPSGNLKFYNLDIFKKLKIAYFSEKNPFNFS